MRIEESQNDPVPRPDQGQHAVPLDAEGDLTPGLFPGIESKNSSSLVVSHNHPVAPIITRNRC